MCGIAGFTLSPLASAEDAFNAVSRMNDLMQRRGPDAASVWTGAGVVLGHRRLAILDLDARANQPMISADGRYTIVFNGEIYNYRDLRKTLEGAGAEFRTTSDTEVLLQLFARQREGMLPSLRGMFAFAVWDAHARELFLARDPYGIKPLYYAQTGNGLLFASQVKALLASGEVSTEIEPAGSVGFCLWGSVPEPWTLYKDIAALPAGSWLKVRDGRAASPVSWHDIRDHWRSTGRSLPPQELQQLVQHAVTDSVSDHLVSDVPVSVFLSGGIDSGAVAGIAAGLGARVEGITLGFREFAGKPDDEIPAAAAIAAHYGLPHFVREVTREEFEADLPSILLSMDQPSIDGVNTWLVSKAAAERGYKVVLSGSGGDELFGGYPSFRQVPRAALVGETLAAIPGMRSVLTPLCSWLGRHRAQPKLAGIPALMNSIEGIYFLRRSIFLPEELVSLFGADFTREGMSRLGGTVAGIGRTDARDGMCAVGLLESTQYLRNQLLRDCDWASMAHSLELRTPLVDAKLLDTLGPYVAGFANGAGKRMLACSPGKPLPDAIINRTKTGFGIPMARWLAESTRLLQPADPGTARNTVNATPWARRWARIVVEAC